MKKILFIICIFTLFFTGCSTQPKQYLYLSPDAAINLGAFPETTSKNNDDNFEVDFYIRLQIHNRYFQLSKDLDLPKVYKFKATVISFDQENILSETVIGAIQYNENAKVFKLQNPLTLKKKSKFSNGKAQIKLEYFDNNDQVVSTHLQALYFK